MKNIGTILAAVVLVAVFAFYMCSFQVRYTEVAIVKNMGKLVGEPVHEPGLRFKAPAPIQSVVKYDNRIRIMEDKTEETRTRDGKNLVLTTYALWRISDPMTFHTNFPPPNSIDEGIRKLRSTIITHKHAVVGRRTMDEFISTDEGTRKLADIETEIEELVAADASREYGIEIVDFGIKKLGLPTQITAAVFDKMKQNEQRKAKQYQSEGLSTAKQIVAEAEAVRSRILAAAREKAAEIESEAQVSVGRLYEEFKEYPELRIFLDEIRILREALMSRSTIILDTANPPFDIIDASTRKAFRPGATELRTPDLGESLDGASAEPAGGVSLAKEKESEEAPASEDGDGGGA